MIYFALSMLLFHLFFQALFPLGGVGSAHFVRGDGENMRIIKHGNLQKMPMFWFSIDLSLLVNIVKAIAHIHWGSTLKILRIG